MFTVDHIMQYYIDHLPSYKRRTILLQSQFHRYKMGISNVFLYIFPSISSYCKINTPRHSIVKLEIDFLYNVFYIHYGSVKTVKKFSYLYQLIEANLN